MIRCSSVILAVGETVDRDFCAHSGLHLIDSGMLDVNRFSLETSRDKFYAGGDLVTGASNISNAMSYGKEAARHIDKRLSGQSRFDAILPQFTYSWIVPEPDPCGRHRSHERPAAERARSFTEAVEALLPDEAVRESSRCLRCDVRDTNGRAAIPEAAIPE